MNRIRWHRQLLTEIEALRRERVLLRQALGEIVLMKDAMDMRGLALRTLCEVVPAKESPPSPCVTRQ